MTAGAMEWLFWLYLHHEHPLEIMHRSHMS